MRAALLLTAAALVAPAAATAQAVDPLAPQPAPPAKAQPADPAAVAPDVAGDPRPGSAATPPVQALPDVRYTQAAPSPAPAATLASATGPRVARDWAAILTAIDRGNWGGARDAIAAMPDDPLKPVALAELYTAKASPRADLAAIEALLRMAPDLPQGQQLQRLAGARGAVVAPPIVTPRNLVFLGSSARRQPMTPVRGDALADRLRAQVAAFVKADDSTGAETLLAQRGAELSPNARAEFGQKTAFIHYVMGRDADARRVADLYAVEASGDWAAQSAWTSALASWRLGDCAAAGAGFVRAAGLASDRELRAGGRYWAARAAQACRRPAEVEGHLRAAAALSDSFYGLVARETLGMPTRLPANRFAAPGAATARANVQRARAAVAIGRGDLADRLLRYQARVGPPSEHLELVQLAHDMGLPQTQYYLAHNGPAGVTVPAAARFPLPAYRPVGGWRVDPAVVLAKARQESEFRPAVVSPDGAVGLMQLLPTTAAGFARQLGRSVSAADLTDPAVNIDYGQIYIEKVNRMQATGGALPKIIASFNAGPLPVGRWASINDKGGDPILWMESLPYWETRLYVPSVMRNVWVYQGLRGTSQQALKDVAEHRFPALPPNSAR